MNNTSEVVFVVGGQSCIVHDVYMSRWTWKIQIWVSFLYLRARRGIL